MSRRTWWCLALASLVLLLALWLRPAAGGAGASVRSPGRLGWQAAHRYLTLRRLPSTLRDRPCDAAPRGATLVVAFPAARRWGEEEVGHLDRHLSAGGRVLYAYSGRPTLAESAWTDHLRLEVGTVRRNLFLHPARWLRFERETWGLRHTTVGGTRERLPVVITAPREVPRPPAGARVLLTGPAGEACAFAVPRGRGLLVVVPSQALANCRLANPGNASLLEELSRLLPAPWEIDEYRHGLAAPRAEATSASARALDALLLHLGLCYVLAVLAIGRRLGPPWRQEVTLTGSVRPFLLGLGRLHDRLRHHSDGARAMLTHARELDPRLEPAELDVTGRPPEPGDRRFLALARLLAARQHPPATGRTR